ncbi:ABC transporter ATP-binding protein [Planotetraspora sp. A-T 1434]|uniref:ABC transporter ATP-binding protein n=1 Tax=Planotetraspora sp. A-T 1434 TaxID=2979219 RepID=UPI0021BE6356|nr:ABC transporter ATP-binding protein [Planotetraspora sp. A-T 1434]MCT9930778.1 ABC transporter ATP-binding protein [Planotetraspora sp. A-T 1434]
MSEAVVTARGLRKDFGPVKAVRDVSLAVDPAEIVAVVGESGSGKTTLGRIIVGLTRPSEGSVTVSGRPQMIFQDVFGSLNPAHDIGHHLRRAVIRSGRRVPDVDREVVTLLERVGLGERFVRRRPHELSGGERQRVGTARALASAPRLIVADEPVSMLDMSVRVEILNLMARLRDDEGVALLYITHDLVSARYLADRVVVMFAGYAVESAPAEELLDDPRHPYTRLLLASVPGSSLDPAPAAGTVQAGEAGCPFAARCPVAVAECGRTMPPVAPLATEPSPGRWLRCHVEGAPL